MNMADLPKDIELQPLQLATISKLYAENFPPSRPMRSAAYRLGASLAMCVAATGKGMPGMYEAGSVAFDAFHAGADEGRAIWARHVAAQAGLPHRQLTLANAADVLAAELIHSSTIISTMLNHITSLQLADVRAALMTAGVIGKTNMVSRAPERYAALVATGFAPAADVRAH